jgi:hypothetical protein
MLDAAAAPDGTVVGITDRDILRTPDLVTWEQVGTAPYAEEDADTQPMGWLGWDGTRFGVSGMAFAGCPEGVDECYQGWLLTSPDGLTWTESAGPDGEPGPDEATQILGMATLGATTVVLGRVGASAPIAWVMDG